MLEFQQKQHTEFFKGWLSEKDVYALKEELTVCGVY